MLDGISGPVRGRGVDFKGLLQITSLGFFTTERGANLYFPILLSNGEDKVVNR